MSYNFPPNASSNAPFSRSEPLLTPEQLKERYLFGLDLKDHNGNELPREVLQQQIDASLSYLEHKLDIIIMPTEFTERYDYRAVDYLEFNFISLKKRPACEVKLIKAKFPNNVDLVEYPKEWYVLEKEGAQVQLSPVEGSFSGLIVTQGGSYVPIIYGTRQYWPHLFEITYVAGFDADCIPKIINEMVGMQAAIRTLEILADIIYGPGITNESTALDGASTSKNINASAGFSAFGARITAYNKQIEEYANVVRKYYNGITFTVG